MATNLGPLEDVSPTENGEMSIAMFVDQRVQRVHN